MIEPPSKPLLEILAELELCRPRDLRRCRPRVRRLAHDLPAFDSVWIDALVQAGRLTPFQATILESEAPGALQVGPCNLVDRLGYGSANRNTYLALHRRARRQCVLKILTPAVEDAAEQRTRLQSVIDAGQSVKHPGAVIPHACLPHDGRLVVISRFVRGFDLRELVIRRGRFHSAIVIELFRQLVAALTELERATISHGDLRLSKVRMTARGQAVLVDAGIDAATRPRASFPQLANAQDCDGIAPELIGTGRPSDGLSDIYSLGCLLWQLLAGRPPFPTGDPLAKLACHQTQPVADIREWAPDTPDRLAEALLAMTSLDRAARPQSFRELQEQWGTPGRRGRLVLRRFHDSFRQAVRPTALGGERRPGDRRVWLVPALLLAASLAIGLGHEGARTHLLAITNGLLETSDPGDLLKTSDTPTDDSGQDVDASATDARRAEELLPLPKAGPDGRVRLQPGQRYRPAAVHADQPLVLETLFVQSDAGGIASAESQRPAEIVIADAPLRLSAPHVQLRSIRVRVLAAERAGENTAQERSAAATARSRSPDERVPALLLCESTQLSIEGCSFESHAALAAGDAPQPRPVSIAWKPWRPPAAEGRAAASQLESVLVVRDTTFAGNATAIYLRTAPQTVRLTNTLKVGGGALCNLPLDNSLAECRCQLQGVTLRAAHSLMRLRITATSRRALPIAASRCVLDVKPSGALFELLSRSAPEVVSELVEVTGDGCLAPVGVTAARWLQDAVPGPVWSGNIAIEGISVAPFTFAGQELLAPQDSELLEFQRPPRITAAAYGGEGAMDAEDNRPGIDAARLARRWP